MQTLLRWTELTGVEKKKETGTIKKVSKIKRWRIKIEIINEKEQEGKITRKLKLKITIIKDRITKIN